MILVIDNYDSFTYNLVQYLGELGARLLVRRNDELAVEDIAELAPERIVISPGPGRPEQAGISVEVIQRFAAKIPILGVCLGHQAIGVAFGGTVVRAPVLVHGKRSVIEHDGQGLFRGIAARFGAARYHSLAVSDQPWPAERESGRRWHDHGPSPSRVAGPRCSVSPGVGADGRGPADSP